MSGISGGAIFLVDVIFDLYIYAALLRLMLQWRRANYYNPICQFLFKLTEPVLKPVRKWFPEYKNLDLTLASCIIILEILKNLLIGLMQFGGAFALGGLVLFTFIDLANKVINVFFYSILISAVLSWLPSVPNNVLAEVTYLISEPLLKIPRRYIPPVSHFDLSPLIAIVVLELIAIVFVNPLIAKGLLIP